MFWRQTGTESLSCFFFFFFNGGCFRIVTACSRWLRPLFVPPYGCLCSLSWCQLTNDFPLREDRRTNVLHNKTMSAFLLSIFFMGSLLDIFDKMKYFISIEGSPHRELHLPMRLQLHCWKSLTVHTAAHSPEGQISGLNNYNKNTRSPSKDPQLHTNRA